MVHVNIFEIAGIGLVLSIVFLTFNCDVVSGVEFVEEPENVTLDSSWKQFTLNCSVAVATSDGIDWVANFDGQTEPDDIFVTFTNYSRAGYSVERPNNRTVNLIIRAVNFQNSSVAGRYCCKGDNGAGTSTCAFVNIATTSSTTSTDLSTTPSGGSSSGGTVAAIVTPSVIVFIIVLLVILLVCFRDPRCPINKRRHPSNRLESRNNETTREQVDLVSDKNSDKKARTSK